ncbi:two-component sensor histidine kinase [Rhodococcus sp. SRB_17]|uniref:sensor histidine kinase n=1 Tax=Rhodococcus sp. OK302 TaxID=1882769 RepID=UPI000B93AA14|nr:HAMP domain-containing sensor histidine kinase [Rhodococcus sp. OK302]NMM89323.1 two-component sensor histidine kinase [Rhodococcus sp. SRB_17]OYD68464.1 signal transduction histidine kinase [Rhodococcus sp. OK302]
MSFTDRVFARWPRPLDPMRSFKVKVGLLVVAALFFASGGFWLTAQQPFRFALLTALVVALGVTQVLAHGMTSPLREMTAAAQAMARGDYSRRVRATSRDEVGELAVAFNRMAEDLGADDQYRRELIGNVSHELRTPITVLQALLENVVDGVQEPNPETMRSALAQTERLGALVADLLDLSKLEGGAIPLKLNSFDLEPFLRDVAAERGTDVAIDVRPPGLAVLADPDRLHQVVTNLVDNAVRHGSTEVGIVIRAYNRVDGEVVIEVNDNGPGIEPDSRALVFDRFTRGGSTDGGTGLGLAIAKWAVELHGGTIAVVDARSGCCIRVVLPQN